MADTFTDFVENLFPSLGQTRQPMLTGTFADPSSYRSSPEAAAYYADPFRKQNAIQQASLDAALKKKQADEAAQRVQGMLSGGGDAAETGDLNPYVAAFLDAETDAERGARLGAFGKTMLGMVTGLPLSSDFATMAGLNSTAGMQGQLAAMYGNYLTQPSIVQNIMSSVAPGRVAAMENAYMTALNQQAAQERGGWEAAAAAEQMAALNQQAADDLAAWNAYESYNTGDSGGGGGGGMSASDVAAASSDMSSLGDTQGAGSYW